MTAWNSRGRLREYASYPRPLALAIAGPTATVLGPADVLAALRNTWAHCGTAQTTLRPQCAHCGTAQTTSTMRTMRRSALTGHGVCEACHVALFEGCGL